MKTLAPFALIAIGLLTACAPPQRVEPTATPTPSPTPLPSPTPIYIPQKRLETARLFNGVELRTTFDSTPGDHATTERETAASYTLDLKLHVAVPKPNRDLAALAAINAELPKLLPGLPALVSSAKVSPLFESLYRQKINELQRDLPRLDQLMSRHNFYDCETILELQHAESKRRALLIQADMDIDTDGSDGDRIAPIDLSSPTFQTMTSYKWAKKTKTPNPLLSSREARLRQLENDAGSREQLAALRAEIRDLKMWSFLVGTADPFIVLPLGVVGQNDPFSPRIGDYCVVISKNMLFPAIVGDAGPRGKIGEASLRIGREINARTTADNRSVSALKVTYLVFPNSGDKPWAAPDLPKWRARCEELLGELGGYTGELRAWEDVTKPAVTPTPTPTPTPSPSPSASPAPSDSPKASPSPSLAAPSAIETGATTRGTLRNNVAHRAGRLKAAALRAAAQDVRE